MWKIVVADHHSAIRNGLGKILSDETTMQIIAEARSSRDLLNKIRNTNPDLVLLDISLPGETGIELLARIKNYYPQLPVLVMSMESGPEYEQMILHAGAAGFIRKDNLTNEVAHAITRTMSGSVYTTSPESTLL